MTTLLSLLDDLATNGDVHVCNSCDRPFTVLDSFGRPNFCPYCGWEGSR